jgi:hypothetical protein
MSKTNLSLKILPDEKEVTCIGLDTFQILVCSRAVALGSFFNILWLTFFFQHKSVYSQVLSPKHSEESVYKCSNEALRFILMSLFAELEFGNGMDDGEVEGGEDGMGEGGGGKCKWGR